MGVFNAVMALSGMIDSDGDLLITMGAGDVTTVGPEYLEHVARKDC